MLNRPAQPMEKKGPVALWLPKPILPYCFFTICGGLAWELHGTGQHGKRSAPLLNLHQDQTKFWLHTKAYRRRTPARIW